MPLLSRDLLAASHGSSKAASGAVAKRCLSTAQCQQATVACLLCGALTALQPGSPLAALGAEHALRVQGEP